jgi:hypothetical protein
MACGLGHLEDEVEYEEPQNDAEEENEDKDCDSLTSSIERLMRGTAL